ncbi:MAG: hypothetical protein KGJ07_06860 [Patescibacteria group bacterium]|nr:hypothetical protein [Patescibacteria group bacterium]MDE2589752.1 hypothetical protein [Patescibacteria group bacterium]
MNFHSFTPEADAQALDTLIIAFLMLFTVVMFMQFGIPNIRDAAANNQLRIVHGSIFDQ